MVSTLLLGVLLNAFIFQAALSSPVPEVNAVSSAQRHTARQDEVLGFVPPPTYQPGWCGVHVTQYRPSEAAGHYRLDIIIKDNAGEEIGALNYADSSSDVSVGVTSSLPWVLILTAGASDYDAVLFAYAGQSWGSNDQQHHCNFGEYDRGARQGDCGFSC
ncbi:uncharacterized protein BDR25DRAFT_378688 [Lindgomyces ingoldianus]|uniref:Uncharacterized protein n=1 Tax=Lindgomyces ingoldianus TaxID=673940 RepID=A0ACB6QF27_9PLEO|nr:uncharacterized protein BDR25DRAFT_378688 [Lindgomyces ingoldianus]KAF2465526.1 hypothetical protein BDR25DRAFT_378688 [Lindgomyces ingoldianus]